MGLHLTTPSENTGGSFGYLSYKATGSLWIYRDMTFKSIKVKPDDTAFGQAAIDLENIQTGWASFQKGAPPVWVMDDDIENPIAKPSEPAENGGDWKRGFKVSLYSQQMFTDDDGVACLSTNAVGIGMGIAQLYEAWENNKQDGMVPVVQIKDVLAEAVGKGNTTVPVFEIVKQIAPPEQLLAVSAPISLNTGSIQAASAQEFSVNEPEFT